AFAWSTRRQSALPAGIRPQTRTHLRRFRDEVAVGFFSFVRVLGLARDRVGENPARPDVDEAPFRLTGHGVGVPPAQEAHVVGALQLLDGGRILFELTEVKLDSALILLAAL